MVVDDEEFCISAMKALLGIFGVHANHIDFCNNGKEAIDQVK